MLMSTAHAAMQELAGSPGCDRTLEFGGERLEVLGELVEQLSFFVVGRKIPDQFAFGHLDTQPFQMGFHVLHRKRPRSRLRPWCQPRPFAAPCRKREPLLVPKDRRAACRTGEHRPMRDRAAFDASEAAIGMEKAAVQGYFSFAGGSSDLLLIQASTSGDLSGSMWSQSRHFITGGGLPSGPKSKSMGLPQLGQGLRSASVIGSPRSFRPQARSNTQSPRLIPVPAPLVEPGRPARDLAALRGGTGTGPLTDQGKRAALILELPEQAPDVLSVKRLCLSQRVEKPSGIHRVVAVAIHVRDQRLLSRNVLVASGYMPFGLGQMLQ